MKDGGLVGQAEGQYGEVQTEGGNERKGGMGSLYRMRRGKSYGGRG